MKELLDKLSRQAKQSFEESGLRFRFTLIRLYRLSAQKFVQQVDIHLLPFVPVMIQSYAYEIIKKEGFDEGMQQGQLERAKKSVADALEARLNVVPLDVITTLKTIDDVQILEELHRKAAIVKDMQEFHSLLQQILEPA